MPWTIQREKKFSKYLKGLGSKELDNLFARVKALENAKDPRTIGIPPKQTRQHGVCYVVHLTSSIVLGYRVLVPERIVQLVVVGDHKFVYGKD
jgi:mRNA-degrading endonuclease RelE of RelBE toxin-antitoxin system